MSFRKRNVALATAPSTHDNATASASQKVQLPGVRPSTIDGRAVTSTGTSTLDTLLAGHGGLALGSSLLIEENGTTDYAGALLRFYAAEGLLQGHHVHVVGLPEQWGRELPGNVESSEKKGTSSESSEKMKIAWRYESLGQFGPGPRDNALRQKSDTADNEHSAIPAQFCHNFDLTKRLAHPPDSRLSFHQLSPNLADSPFKPVIASLTAAISASAASTVHRLILPSLLSPLMYPTSAANPHNLLPFLHTLRGHLSTTDLTILTTLPTSLHPRTSGLTRWIELLHDGVVELAPFPHTQSTLSLSPASSDTRSEEPPHGLLRVHRLPVLAENGSGKRSETSDDWTFSLSRRKFRIEAFTLPPVEGDTEAQEQTGSGEKAAKKDLEY